MSKWTFRILISLSALLAGGCGRNEAPPQPDGPPHSTSELTAIKQPETAQNGAALDTEATPANPPGDPAADPQASSAAGDAADAQPPTRKPDVVYVPTPQPIVDKMLALARVKKSDIVYDLGCGDGRIVVTAAKKYGTKAWGFDIDPARIAEARENVKKNNVEHLVTIEQKDIFTLDLSPASVVTLYLLPELNVKLIPQLEKLKNGSRIVSHDFDMAGVKPLKQLSMKPEGADREHGVYLWHTPLKKENAAAAKP